MVVDGGSYHEGPFRFHAHVVLVGEQSRHVTHRHLLVDQQRFRTSICCERLHGEGNINL